MRGGRGPVLAAFGGSGETVSSTVRTSDVAVPPLNLAAGFAAIREELLREITAICDSGYYVLGPKVSAFEDALARACGAKHALGLSSGTDALLLALMALDIGPGDEVIVPSFTFFATAGVVSRVGATPVFCDIDPETYNCTRGHVEPLITSRTKAVIPVHLYGQLCDINPLLDLAKQKNLHVIEDACQAIAAADATGRQAGAFGLCGSLSFYPTKNLGAIGDAGALLFRDDTAFFEKCRQFRLHGETQKYHHQYVGGNFRIDALQAAILNIKLPHLDTWTRQRRQRAARYSELFTAAGLCPEFVRLPAERIGTHTYHQYVVRAGRRDELVKHLSERKIGSGIYYPIPLHLQECFAALGGRKGQLPHSEKAAAEVLALPMYPELTDEQQQAVVAAVADFYRR
jgi:dTDP-4-amino-4,6-dideoxygalactose transaminase